MPHQDLGTCPRCAYRGEGISHFSRGRHVALLVGLTVITASALGVGGVIYFLVRRKHHNCPRCGKGWGRYGELSRVPRPAPVPRATTAADRGSAPVATGSAASGWSVFLWIVAALFITAGLAGGWVGPLLFGTAAAVGAGLLHKQARRERQARGAVLLADQQRTVVRLAGRLGGRLTVTTAAAELGWTMPHAEEVLNSLDDGLRVDSQVTDDGVIVYEFVELIHGPRPTSELEAESMATRRPSVAAQKQPSHREMSELS